MADDQRRQSLEPSEQQLWLSVELLTDSYWVRGRLAVTQAATRLVDILNSQGQPFLPLLGATIRPLSANGAGAKSQRVTYGVTYVSRAAIFLAMPRDLQQTGARPITISPLDYLEKVPHGAELVLPPFRVRGMLHLGKLGHLADIPFSQGAPFLPMTKAEAVYMPSPDLVWRSEVIVVNMAKAQAYYDSPL